MPWNWAEARRESIGLRVDLTCSEDESADTASLTLNFAHGAKKHIKSNGTLGPSAKHKPNKIPAQVYLLPHSVGPFQTHKLKEWPRTRKRADHRSRCGGNGIKTLSL